MGTDVNAEKGAYEKGGHLTHKRFFPTLPHIKRLSYQLWPVNLPGKKVGISFT